MLIFAVGGGMSLYEGYQYSQNLALEVEFQDFLSTNQVEEAIERLQTSIQIKHPDFKQIFIEASSVSSQRLKVKAATVAA